MPFFQYTVDVAYKTRVNRRSPVRLKITWNGPNVFVFFLRFAYEVRSVIRLTLCRTRKSAFAVYVHMAHEIKFMLYFKIDSNSFVHESTVYAVV